MREGVVNTKRKMMNVKGICNRKGREEGVVVQKVATGRCCAENKERAQGVVY